MQHSSVLIAFYEASGPSRICSDQMRVIETPKIKASTPINPKNFTLSTHPLTDWTAEQMEWCMVVGWKIRWT